MSDDLIERLRARGTRWIDLHSPGSGHGTGFFPDPLCAEAAAALAAKDAEIERAQSRANQNAAEFEKLMASYQSLRARLARAEAERDAANKELRILLDACEASPWHPIKTGEMVKRILVAESALVRMRTHFAALDATKEKNDGG